MKAPKADENGARVNADARGWRVALLPDLLVNPAERVATLPDTLALLDAAGYGLLQLPPPGSHRVLLAVTADQVAEYAHHGYAVVAIGVRGEREGGLHWRRLTSLLTQRDTPPPPRHIISPAGVAAAEAARLATFLAGYDLPVEEQRRWRV